MGERLTERYGMHPADIEVRSFAVIDELVPADLLPPDPWARLVAKRMIHAVGDPDLARVIRMAEGAVSAGVAALRAGCPLFTDVRMAAAGINAAMTARLGNAVRCMGDDPRVPAKATAERTTRAIAGVRLHAAELEGAVVAIGNAPTALLALLDLVDEGVCRPALVIGTPVGFVSAAESKDELVQRSIPYITALGYRGGSAMAAAAANALLKIATDQAEPGAHIRDRWGGGDHAGR